MGIYGKLKSSATSIASKASRRSTVSRQQQQQSNEVAATESYAPPTEDLAASTAPADTSTASVAASATATASIAAAPFETPPNNIIISNKSDGINNNSKKKALLGDEERDPEMGGGNEIAENKSIISKASSYIKSHLSINNSTIATNTSLGMDQASFSSSDPQKVNKSQGEKKSCQDSIMERITLGTAALLALWYSLSKVAQVAVLTGAAVGVVGVVALVVLGGRTPAFPSHINVAFVGNSYFYVNDLPRFVQNLGGGHISQDSVLHNSASILNIIMTGNGMYKKWATTQAMINGVKYENTQGETAYLYDMGACSVPQLLTGHDEMITKGNALGTFKDDGSNPCFQSEDYREYHESTGLKIKGGWDFVVIVDQSESMAIDENREQALTAFNYTYGPLLKKKNISPIIVQPHAYFVNAMNSTDVTELATYTALIMEGAQIYKKYLNRRTGWFSHAHIAPVGNAFMSVFEESQYDIYPKLFMDDGIHPSAYGTFLYGTVIYATMTGYMPKYNRVVVDDMENSEMFATARRLQASSSAAGFPTKEEADILFKIAKKVAIRGYKPQALRRFKVEAGASDFLAEDEDYNNDYEGDYDNQYVENYYNVYNSNDQYQNGGYNNEYDNGAYNNGNQYNGGYGNQYNGGYNNGNNNNNQNANDQYYNTDDAAQQQNGNGQYQQNYNYNNGN